MKTDTENVEKISKEESRITRRKMIQITAVGALVAATGLHIVYRRSSNKALAPTLITIEGPFKNYGYFRPEDLGREDLKNLASDFKLQTLILDEGKYGDSVMISFTFTGKEDPNRKMKIFLTMYDKDGKVIGGAENTFADPRIVAKEQNGKGIVLGRKVKFQPVATLNAKIGIGGKISQVKKVLITAVSIVQSSANDTTQS